MRICGQNQPSGAEFIEIRVFLTNVECSERRLQLYHVCNVRLLLALLTFLSSLAISNGMFYHDISVLHFQCP